MAPTSERIEFTGHDGESRLAARLERPRTGMRAAALFAHCFTCSKDVHAATRIADALADRGFAVLRFDFTGLGGSEGDFANTNFSSNVGDLVAAARFMAEEGYPPQVLVGHSLGGAAVLAAAPEIETAKAVATIGAPADPGHVAHHFDGQRERIEAEGRAKVTIGGRDFTIEKQFLDDLGEHRLAETVRRLDRALLIFHAPRDNIVGIDNAAEIFEAARHPKSFVSLDDADHLLTRKADSIYVADVLAAWAGRYIDAGSGDAGDAAETGGTALPEGYSVLVAEKGGGRFAQAVRAGSHVLAADEPEDAGGGDTGPGPYEYLLAGLGACTSMTLRMYAERKKWEVGRISVALRHGKVHAEDCAECEEKDGKIDRIERLIRIEGELDDEQRARLMEIADKCPVHRTLTGHIEVVTRAAED